MNATGSLRQARTRLPGAVVTLVFAVVLMAPLLFRDTTLGGDNALHQWLVWQQERAIRAGGFPSWFSHYEPVGMFSPSGIFFSGSLYGAVGYLAVILGTPRAFVVAHVLLAWGALIGCRMLSRTLGLRGWYAHVPGIAVVTGAWYLGEAVGRASFGSFAAMSAMPLFLAGLVGLAQARAVGASDTAALIVGTVLVFGAHNLSMLWSAIFLSVGAVVVAIVVRGLRLPPPRRLAAIGGFAVLGLGINAWFLVPNLLYSSRTHIGQTARMDAVANAAFARPSVVFHPLRTIPTEHTAFWRNQAEGYGWEFEGASSLYTQVPVVAFAWATAVIVAARRRPQAELARQLFLAAAVVVVGFLALVLEPSLFDRFPSFLHATQYTFRLHTYVLFAVAAAVGAAVATVRHLAAPQRRVATLSLAGVGALSLGLAVWQGWTATSVTPGLGYDIPRAEVLASAWSAPFWYPYNDFWDKSAPVVDSAVATAWIGSFDAVEDGRLAATIRLPVARAVALPVGTGPYLLRIHGSQVLGRTADGHVVVKGARSEEDATRRIVLEPARTPPLVAGVAVTAASLGSLLVGVAAASAAGVRRRVVQRSASRRTVPAAAPFA